MISLPYIVYQFTRRTPMSEDNDLALFEEQEKEEDNDDGDVGDTRSPNTVVSVMK